jgi:hypothetical protein
MKKFLIACLLTSIFFIPIIRAETLCYPTISWKIDSQFFIGETGKLIANLDNPCEVNKKVKVEVNAKRTEGYIKVYSAFSEDQKPLPRTHDMQADISSVDYILDRKGLEESKKKIVFFIQPDEKTLQGTYTLYENFYVEGELRESKEVSISVSKPIKLTYKIPTSLKFNTPTASSVSINNAGTEIISYLKMCLSANDDVVSFSEKCKTWTNIPSRYTDTFNFMTTGLSPGSYQNIIKVDMDYTTYTGLAVSDSYYLPSLTITTTQKGIPDLSYSLATRVGSLNLVVNNKGNGTAYNCLARIKSPYNCPLNSTNLKKYVKTDEVNVYEIDCGIEIPVKESSSAILTFKRAEIAYPCLIEGSISYKDGTGKIYETRMKEYYLNPVTTTIPTKIPEKKMPTFLIITILVVIAMIVVELLFLKYKRPETYAKIVQSLKKIFEKIKVFKSEKKE